MIAYGNTLRRDDGAGIALAERMVAHWQSLGRPVRLITDSQLLPEMAELVAGEHVKALVFVDTSADRDGRCIQVSDIDLDSPTPSSGHQLGPSALLVYAALLYGRQPRAWLVTIPGHDFTHGEGFSPKVQHLLDTAPIVAIELLSTIEELIPCMN
jgi:hydrogenase maturation protease